MIKKFIIFQFIFSNMYLYGVKIHMSYSCNNFNVSVLNLFLQDHQLFQNFNTVYKNYTHQLFQNFNMIYKNYTPRLCSHVKKMSGHQSDFHQ